MLKFYYHPSPNPAKIALFLEETGLPYEMVPVDTRKGEQFKPEFLAINPNAKTPALTDGDATIFDSNAILLYLAEKTGQFLPENTPKARGEMLSWLMFVATGIGPYCGQAVHFGRFAPEKIPYAINRYTKEAGRLYGVLDRRLTDRAFVAGDTYSIADMASYPWIAAHAGAGQDPADYPSLKRWFDLIAARPATVRAYARGDVVKNLPDATEEERQRVLFGNEPAT